jgi:hypothetical protein
MINTLILRLSTIVRRISYSIRQLFIVFDCQISWRDYSCILPIEKLLNVICENGDTETDEMNSARETSGTLAGLIWPLRVCMDMSLD